MTQIINEVKEKCVLYYVKNRELNIADMIYEYIDDNREMLEGNADCQFGDDDLFAEEIGMELDEDEIIAEAESIIKIKAC